MIRETDFAAPKEIVDIVLNGSRLQPLIVKPDEIYTDETPVSPVWRGRIFEDTQPLTLDQPVKTHHQARKEFLQNMGI